MFVKYIDNDNKWEKFLESKKNSEYVNKYKIKQLSKYVENKEYKSITEKLKKDNYIFNTPYKKIINKINSQKKRIVYSFNKSEMNVLKFISHNLYEYDYLFCNNLYSFRKNKTVPKAIHNLSKISNLKNMYGYKVDISNYFNTININILLSNLKKDITDKELYKLIENILTNEYIKYNNKIIKEEKGVMAGIPISAFLANYYLKDMDHYFSNKRLVYIRYSDDIIIFCNTLEELNENKKELLDFLDKYDLKINKAKEKIYYPGDLIEFLGFSFKNNKRDISNNSFEKIKRKIKRHSRKMRKKVENENLTPEKALKRTIKKFNRKFFITKNNSICWSTWYFSYINTKDSLKKIDKYYQDNLRYIVTGKHNKKNYKIVSYKYLKQLGYRSLVNEYYLFLNMKSDM